MQRNPFRIQTSEQSSPQEEFLSLFGSEVLDLLPQNTLWDRMLVLEAAPGAGKSTMLRLFTPEVLKEVQRNSARSENTDVIRRLKRLGALSQSGHVQVLGTVVSCRGQYAAIDDLSLTEAQKTRWFFGLLDARVTLLTLKSLCEYAGINFPDDLPRVKIIPISTTTDTVRRFDDAFTMFSEAANREDSLVSAIDSLTNQDAAREALRTELRSLRLFSSCRFELNDLELPAIGLTMFDDVQDLTPRQQKALVDDLESRDIRTGRWVARRLDVLSIDELLPSGGKDGRDYECDRIEDWARNSGIRFQRLLEEIADRRIRKTDIAVESFASLVDEQLVRPSEIRKAQQTAEKVRDSIVNSYGGQIAYSKWFEQTVTEEREELGEHSKNATRWRALGILLNRRRRRRSGQVLNKPWPREELLQQRGSDVMTAAELLVSIEYGTPFYFGLRRLSGLASANIEQFLRIGGALMDRYMLLQITGRRKNILASEQDSIARQLARAAIDALPRDVPYGSDVLRLIQSIGTLSRDVTTRETASYSPGVLGIGLKESQVNYLLKQGAAEEIPNVGRLKDALKSAISHNVLEPHGPLRVKGDSWMVFYLNRMLSPAFGLPVTSSQFQGVDLEDIVTWVVHGYREPSRQERLLP